MVIVVMGVAGSGKTTVGRQLSQALGWTFYDADDFHPPANIEKMSRGVPLNDGDRLPWLQALGELIRDCLKHGESAVLACSALKASYREFLLVDPDVKLAYLKGDYALIQERLTGRRGHYMKPGMLDSQFATLEEPEQALHLDISPPPSEIVQAIRARLGI